MIDKVRGVPRHIIIFISILVGLCAARASVAETFSIGDKDFLLNGEAFPIRCGEMHFARIPREYWAHRLRMAHAMGLNTVCAYLFWNVHEPAPGKFDFSGNADAAEFCRLAQAEGLHVILRPGPYSCAEWDFGGLPWWLLKTPDIKVRTRDPHYLAACKKYLVEVGKELAAQQITHGGPIIMVQVENEYGSFGSDKEYMGIIRDDIKAAGFDVPLFTCDGPKELKNDTRDDLFCVVNIGSHLQQGLKTLREIRPNGPLMIGEYYPGWFDSWGEPHHTGSTTNIAKELGWMLNHNVSFSIYMVHGGTTFGFDAGANYFPPFSPEITSYDYDAPISEAGWETPKFDALRALFSKHLTPGETLPDPPPPNPVIEIPPMEFNECAPLFSNLPPAKHLREPKPMELFGQPHGAMLYRTQLPAGDAGKLRFTDLNDYGLIFLDGKKIATVDRRLKQDFATLPAREHSATLDVLVDSFGHITYGHGMGDRKGITRKVEWETAAATNAIKNWKAFNLPFDEKELGKLHFQANADAAPAFYRARFSLNRVGDTFLDMRDWNKGLVWINGHNLGRYWRIGPQQTLYCPGCWLKSGQNEITVLEFNGAQRHTVAGLTTPILDQVAK